MLLYKSDQFNTYLLFQIIQGRVLMSYVEKNYNVHIIIIIKLLYIIGNCDATWTMQASCNVHIQ